jgi:RNA polymerase sigma-70 factor (ECF subfamily)
MPLTVEEVHERFDAGLRRFVAARVGDPDSAEDVVQDVYLKIQGHIGTIEDEEKVGSWVYRVARNAVYDFYRTRKPTQELDEFPLLNPQPHGRQDGGEAVGVRKGDARRPLPRPEDRPLPHGVRRHDPERPRRRAGISVSGAKSRVQRARARLKALLPDCCYFELDRRGKVINYYDREHPPDPRPGTP